MKHLIHWFEHLLHPLTPKATQVQPSPPGWKDFGCIAFDIYGTLLISASGDIGLSSEDNRVNAMSRTFELLKIRSSLSAETWAERFKMLILDHQGKVRAQGIEFPEVEIREVWLELLSEGQRQGELKLPCSEIDLPFIEQVAVVFECLSNPVWPMPGAMDRIKALQAEGKTLAIVSNAQFYTPLLLQFFLGTTLKEAGFAAPLCFYSYALREGKPGQRLYRDLAKALQAQGVAPAQCLYIGNDQRNDVWPAQITGFGTALFAGDQRSLRLREDDPRCNTIKPDHVMTEW